MNIDKQYIIRIRRELHQVPEIGFNLSKTFAIIRRELDAIGLPYTEEWSQGSIIATLNEGVGHKTIAIRADNDGLPIQEETGLEFSSTIPGQMHACGHDCHTAMVLGAAKALKEMENEIKCCVKFVFQGPEEGPSGARVLCENGLMDGIDQIIGCHISPTEQAGAIRLNKGCMNASSHSFLITLRGRSCHVARPHQGVDAIAMAARVYTDIQIMRAREVNPFSPVVVGIGTIQGGTAPNILCDQVTMKGTIRTLDGETDEKIFRRISEICENTARDMGGSAELETLSFTPAVLNDPAVAEAIGEAALKVADPALFTMEKPTSMGAEDFSRFIMEKPGAMFTLGVSPAHNPRIPLHNGKVVLNEEALDIAPKVFIQFVLDQMEQ